MTDLTPIPPDLFPRAAAYGADLREVLARAKLRRSQHAFTTAEQMAFWQALLELAPSRDIGLRLGSERTAEQLNLAELSAIHAPTLGEALARIARYKRLVCAEEVSLERKQDEVRLGFHWLHAEGPLPHLVVECVFAAVVKLVSVATGARFVPRRLELSRRRDHVALLEAHFGCPVVFDAAQDRLVLARSDLERRFHPPNGARYAKLFPILEAKLATRPRCFADEVRAALRRRMVGEHVTIAMVARELARTPRTLQRHLVKEGTTYQALLDEVRRATAKRLLVSTELQEPEIAFLLGFAELNSFTRAFRQWEGTTPRRWRLEAVDGLTPASSRRHRSAPRP